MRIRNGKFDFDWIERKFGLFAEGDEEASDAGTGTEDGNSGTEDGNKTGSDNDASGSGSNDSGSDDSSVSWRDLVTEPDLQKVAGESTDLNHAFKRISDMRQQLSKSITIPGKDATDEQKASFNKAIGVPENISDYEFPDLADGVEMTDAIKASRDGWAQTFHDNGVPKDAAAALIEAAAQENADELAARIKADKDNADATDKALHEKWPGEEYDLNRKFADRAATKLFGDNFDAAQKVELKDGRFLMDLPMMSEMFATVGRQMQEGQLGDSIMSNSDRQTLQTKIDDLGDQIDKAQAKSDDSKANQLYAEQQELYRQQGNGPIVGSESRAA